MGYIIYETKVELNDENSNCYGIENGIPDEEDECKNVYMGLWLWIGGAFFLYISFLAQMLQIHVPKTRKAIISMKSEEKEEESEEKKNITEEDENLI